MDRSVKKIATTPEWDALLLRIRSHSHELEAGFTKSSSNLIEALSALHSLEELTAAHLIPEPAPQAAAPASRNETRLATPAPNVRYGTSHEEYAPALDQSALIDALLKFQRAKAGRQQIAKPTAPKILGAPPPRESASFAPMSFPTVDVEPKKAPIGRTSSPSVRLPVLRVKNPGKPHGQQD